MALLVVGKIIIQSGRREEFLKIGNHSIIEARNNDRCLDFSAAPDSIERDRVNIFEKWESAEALAEFRAGNPGEEALSLIEVFDLNEYEVSI